MSADNWRDCPSCKRADVFREDYEIGVWDGDFQVHYTGCCQECNFAIRYNYQKNAIEQGFATQGDVL